MQIARPGLRAPCHCKPAQAYTSLHSAGRGGRCSMAAGCSRGGSGGSGHHRYRQVSISSRPLVEMKFPSGVLEGRRGVVSPSSCAAALELISWPGPIVSDHRSPFLATSAFTGDGRGRPAYPSPCPLNLLAPFVRGIFQELVIMSTSWHGGPDRGILINLTGIEGSRPSPPRPALVPRGALAPRLAPCYSTRRWAE